MQGGWFKPLRAEPSRKEVLGFDVEGVGGPEGFLCGSIVGSSIYNFFTDRQEMWDALLYYGAQGFYLYAHNLQYDLPIVEGDDFPSGRLLFTRGALLWGDYTRWGKRVRFLDSYNLFPRFSVGGLGRLVNCPKLEVSPALLAKLRAGRPWSFYTPEQQEELRRYNQRDSEIVYLAVEFMQDIALYLGGQLQSTIAGVSMDVYRRRFHKWPWKVLGPATNETARPAFYGGRVENFAFGRVPGVNMYDVTSLYPYVQSQVPFPHPNHLKFDPAPRAAGEWWKWEGVAQVKVRVPEQYIPILPYRYNKRLFFPWGEMHGLWSIYELREAVKLGVQVLEVDWVLGSPVTFNPFEDFVEQLFHLREHYLVSNPGHANILKLILNSLYGRWGLNPEGGLYRLVDLESVEDLEDLRGFTTTAFNGRLFAYGQIETKRIPDYVNVLFAAQIASAGRVHLLKELLRQGERAIYCDTDSIITTGEIETGEGLGAWREQMTGGVADMIAPKEYALHNSFFGSTYKAKGVPPGLAEQYIKQGQVRFRKALSVREAIGQGRNPAEWVETFKTHRDVCPKRFPLPSQSPGSREWMTSAPYQVQELPEATAGRWSAPDFGEVFQVPVHLVEALPSQGQLDLLHQELEGKPTDLVSGSGQS
jgi:hypothetical protein